MKIHCARCGAFKGEVSIWKTLHHLGQKADVVCYLIENEGDR